MKKIIVISIIIFNISQHNVVAQINFQKGYNSRNYSFAYSVQQTTDSGFISIGASSNGSNPFIDYDVVVIRTKAGGDTIWTRVLGGTHEDVGVDVKQTADGGFIGCGDVYDTVYHNISPYLFRLNSTGDTLWNKTFGSTQSTTGDVFHSVIETSDGFLAGGALNASTVGAIAFLTKTDVNGNMLWSKTYRAGITEISCIEHTLDNSVIISGLINYNDTMNADILLVKVDTNGSLLWSKAYGGPSGDGGLYGITVKPTADSGYAIAGTTTRSNATLYYLIKTNKDGDTLWTRTYNTSNGDFGTGLCLTNDGGYVISGRTRTNDPFDRVYLVRTDSSGNVIWSKKYGRSYVGYRNLVERTTDGGFIVGAQYMSGDGLFNSSYLIKTDGNGYTGCGEEDAPTIMGFPNTIVRDIAITVVPLSFIVINSAVAVTNIDSLTDLCLTQGLPDIENPNEIAIYPNPATNYLTINCNGFVEIFNSIGEKVVAEKLISRTIYFNQPAGIYFVKVTEGKKIFTEKLVLE